MAEEIEPGEDDQHGEVEETGNNWIEHDSGLIAVRIGSLRQALRKTTSRA